MTMKTETCDTAALVRFFQRGGALRMLFDTDASAELDVLFRYAKQLASAGEYGSAARLLRMLTIYDAWSFEYWFELGACCQADGAWADAIYAYGRAAQMRISQAKVPCAAGECYLACGNQRLAAKAFRAALLLCDAQYAREQYETPALADIRRRAQAGLAKSGGEYDPDTQ